MKLDVFQTDAEAFEATAARAVEVLGADVGAAGGGRLAVALAGGRTGRGVMVALAARGDLPWDHLEWFWSEERCVPADDPRSNVRLAEESLFRPRGVAAARIHRPPVELGDPGRVAAAYAATLGGARLALVLLGLGAHGEVAALAPGGAALRAVEPVAPVPLEEVPGEPHVGRITLTPPALRAARHVIVTVVGDRKARALAAALRDPGDPARQPAHLVRPADTVDWIVDRAAATELLRDARPAAD